MPNCGDCSAERTALSHGIEVGGTRIADAVSCADQAETVVETGFAHLNELKLYPIDQVEKVMINLDLRHIFGLTRKTWRFFWGL